MSLNKKSFEIFCGTGGVGKTTLATARALSLTEKKLRVLLITIDPAKRLKDLLGLDEQSIGEVVQVEMNQMKLHALLMSPEKTIQRMATNYKLPDLADNRIIKILSKPYGGMNEILSMVEVQMQFDSGQFDVIVLDTPPGSHFLDFLESLNKISSFFDQNFMEIFSYFGQKTANAGKKVLGIRILNKVISSGVKKLLNYLQSVTGAKFIEDFIEAVQIIYQSRDAFIKGLVLKERLKSKDQCNWFLVTSVEQGKAQQAIEMRSHATHFIHQDHFLILNKCLNTQLQEWHPSSDYLQEIKLSLEDKETKLKNQLKQSFKEVLEFPEIISLSPADHLTQLTQQWKSYDVNN